MRYLAIIVRGERAYSACIPDVLGCIATGRTFDECKANMQSVLQEHIECMLSSGYTLPEPHISIEDPKIPRQEDFIPVYVDIPGATILNKTTH